jgi:large repetitive protein
VKTLLSLMLAVLQTFSSATITHVVITNKNPVKLTLTASSNVSTQTSSVTFSGTVSSNGLPAPTGNVSLYDGNTLESVIPLTPLGVVTGYFQYTMTGMAQGVHTITAVYSGDANYY